MRIKRIIMLIIIIGMCSYSEEFSQKNYSKIIIKDLKEYIIKNKKKHSLYNEIMIKDRADAILNEYSKYYSDAERNWAEINSKNLDSFSPVRTKYTTNGLHIMLISSGFTQKLWHYAKVINEISKNENMYDILDGIVNSDTNKIIKPVAIYIEDLGKKKTEDKFSMKIFETDIGYEKNIAYLTTIRDKEIMSFIEKNKLEINTSEKIKLGKWNVLVFENFEYRFPLVELVIDNEIIKIK